MLCRLGYTLHQDRPVCILSLPCGFPVFSRASQADHRQLRRRRPDSGSRPGAGGADRGRGPGALSRQDRGTEPRLRRRGNAPAVFGRVPEALGSAPRAFGSTPEVFGSAPELLGRTPEALGSTPEVLGSAPEAFGRAPEVLGSVPEALGSIPEALGSAPEAFGTTPEPFGSAESRSNLTGKGAGRESLAH